MWFFSQAAVWAAWQQVGKLVCVECTPKLELPFSCPGCYCSGPIKGVGFKTFPFHAEMKQSSCLHSDSVSPWACLSCSHSGNPEVWLSCSALSPSSMSLSTLASRSGIDDETDVRAVQCCPWIRGVSGRKPLCRAVRN